MTALAVPAPTFSVLLPFFKDRDTVGAAIESVCAQSLADWEIIAIDDGSSDGSLDVVTAHADRDTRIKIVRQHNRGLGAARNAGLREANGRYCALLDADDTWLPPKLERQQPLLAERTVVFSDAFAEESGRRYRIGRRLNRPEGDFPRGDVFDELLRQNFISVPTTVLPTELLRSVGGFAECLRVAADWDLWLRLALLGVRFDYVSEPLAVYAIRPGSLSRDPDALRSEQVEVLRRLRRSAVGRRRAPISRRLALARRELAVFYRKRAWSSATAGDSSSARRDLFASIRTDPRSLRSLVAAALGILPPLLRWYATRQPPATFDGEFVVH